MDDLLRIVLPIYFVAFIAIAVVWRCYVVWKSTGINPFRWKISNDVYGYVGFVLALTFVLNLLAVVSFAFFPWTYKFLVPFDWLNNFYLKVLGLLLGFIPFVWIVAAQAQMGGSWRIAIDKENETELVASGLFAFSRNPIFLGIRISLVGCFLIIPNAVTLLSTVLGNTLIQIQVRLEEEHLAKLHAKKYIDYQQKVRRWV